MMLVPNFSDGTNIKSMTNFQIPPDDRQYLTKDSSLRPLFTKKGVEHYLTALATVGAICALVRRYGDTHLLSGAEWWIYFPSFLLPSFFSTFLPLACLLPRDSMNGTNVVRAVPMRV